MLDRDRVLNLKEVGAITGLSVATLRRLIDRGDGPCLTQLSPRRQGIRESHLTRWLNGRLRDHDEHQDHAA